MILHYGVLDKFYDNKEELYRDLEKDRRRLIAEEKFKMVLQRFLSQYDKVKNVIYNPKLS